MVLTRAGAILQAKRTNAISTGSETARATLSATCVTRFSITIIKHNTTVTADDGSALKSPKLPAGLALYRIVNRVKWAGRWSAFFPPKLRWPGNRLSNVYVLMMQEIDLRSLPPRIVLIKDER